MGWIKELILALTHSLKLLWKGKQTTILLVVSFLLLSVMLLALDSAKDEKSKIIIGVADSNQSELSRQVLLKLKEKELYKVVEGEEAQLLNLLKKGEVSAVCVLKESFSEDISQGKTKNLITVYESKNKTAPLLGDIFAGVMMEEICLAKGYQMLYSYEEQAGKEKMTSPKEYRAYVASVAERLGTDFFFDVEYISGDGKIKERPSQSVVYQQAVFAIFALMSGLISMYSVLPFRKLRYGVTASRVKTLPVHCSALYAGSAMGGLLVPTLFGCIFLGCFAWKNSLNFSQIISLLVCTMVYVCVIVCMMLLAATVMKKENVYQMSMLAMILLFGVFGLISLVEGVIVPEGICRFVPNGWFVHKMTELTERFVF